MASTVWRSALPLLLGILVTPVLLSSGSNTRQSLILPRPRGNALEVFPMDGDNAVMDSVDLLPDTDVYVGDSDRSSNDRYYQYDGQMNHKEKYRENDSEESIINSSVIIQNPNKDMQRHAENVLHTINRNANSITSSINNPTSSTSNTSTGSSISQAGINTSNSGSPSTSNSPRSSSTTDSVHFNSRRLKSVSETGPSNGTEVTESHHGSSDGGSVDCSSDHGEPGVHLVTLRWQEVGVYFTITAFVIFAGLGKLAFHQLHWLSSKVPESCLLIVLGLMMGLLIHFTAHETNPEKTCHNNIQLPSFTSQAFFLVLLPPIILESAYSLHDRSFIDNIGTVLIFAVFGTLLNIFIIGPSLYGLAAVGAMGSINLTLTESLVFSSLISAVDPVAVLNIFQDLCVNKGLYFLVFGESLLNDGVTVVVYNTLSVFMDMSTVRAKDYLLSVVAFFVVSLCGAIIGIIYGLITALVTRATTTVRVVEPLALLGFAYLSYLSAELFHFSGIISLIFCGLVQAHYAFQNISSKSYTCVKYFTKMASATSETIIFMFLGMVLVSDKHVWHTGFILWTLVLCFVVRFIITLSLSAATNCYRLHPIGMKEQLILAYGGLRGAVAFSLVTMLPEDLPLRDLFVTATLVVILFTVFVQGISIRPLVTFLNVSRKSTAPKKLFEEVHQNVVDHMMAGIEEVLGQHGDFYLREQMRHYNEKYLKKWFVRSCSEAPLKRLFEKIAITDHYAHLYGPAVLLEQRQQHHQLSISRQKLVEDDDSPTDTKTISMQALNNSRTELPLDPVTLPGSLPSVQLRETSTRGSETRLSIGGGRKGSITPATSSTEDECRRLRRAISSNPYNQYHYTYNRNLVNEDRQELADHLLRRREKAKRLTRLASVNSLRHSSNPALDHTGQPQVPRYPSYTTTAPQQATPSYNNTYTTVPTTTATGGGGASVAVVVDDPLRRANTTAAAAVTNKEMTPVEDSQVHPHEQRKQSGWNQSRAFMERMNTIPREVSSPPPEVLTSVSEDFDADLDIRGASILIDRHRRISAYRQSARRRRTSSDYDSVDDPSPVDPLLSSRASRSALMQRQSSTPHYGLHGMHGQPPYLPSFSTPETDGYDQEQL